MTATEASPYALRPSVDGGPVRVPKGRYLDDAYAARERSHLWARTWQLACLVSDVDEPGRFTEYRIADQGYVVVRGDDGVLRAFHNVCPHRGFRICEGSGRCDDGTFRCGYHHWRFGLDGAVREITSQRGFGVIDRDALGLRPVHVDTWAGLVFVNPSPGEVEPLHEFLDSLPGELAPFALDARHCTFRCTVEMEGNWKVTVDAFNEVYHLQGLHPQLMPFMDDVHTTYRTFANGHSMMQIPLGVASPRLGGLTESEIARAFHECYATMLGDAAADGPALDGRTARDYAIAQVRARCAADGLDLGALDDAQVLDDFHYLAFPNVVFNVHGEMHTVFRARPGDTPHRSYFDFFLFHRLGDGVARRPDEHVVFPPGARVTEVLDQDLDGVARVHTGLRSAGIDEVVLADFECRLFAMHAELDRRLGEQAGAVC